LLCALALLVAHLPQAAPTRAATLTVTTTADSGPGSLRAAIQSASAGDTITFGVTGTIALTTGPLRLDKNLTITGPGSGSLAVDGSNQSQVFLVGPSAASQAVISGLTIQHGTSTPSGGGVFISAGSTLILANAVVTNNTAPSAGGIDNRGTLMLSQ